MLSLLAILMLAVQYLQLTSLNMFTVALSEQHELGILPNLNNLRQDTKLEYSRNTKTNALTTAPTVVWL